MKKITDAFIAIVFMGAFFQPGFSQDALTYGQPVFPMDIRLPSFGWDLLRGETPGWIRERRDTYTSPWQNSDKVFAIRYDNDWFLQLYRAGWNAGTQQWNTVSDYKYTFVKDGANQLAEIKETSRNPFNSAETKYTIEYTPTGKIKKISHSLLNTSTGAYDPFIQEHYLYNSAGQKIKDSVLGFDGTQFNPVTQICYEYDASSQCTKIISLWGSQWDTSGYTVYRWYSFGKLQQASYYSLDGPNPPIRLRRQYNFSYDANARPLEVRVSYINSATNAFGPQELYTHYYAANTRLSGFTAKLFSNDKWILDDSIVLFHTPNYQDTGHEYRGGPANWEPQHSYRLRIGTGPLGVGQMPAEASVLKAYPNPATDALTLEFEQEQSENQQWRLTDINGKTLQTIEVITIAGPNSIDVPLGGIAPGVYLLSTGNSTVKIIKQ